MYCLQLEHAFQHIAAIAAILQRCKLVEIGRRMNCSFEDSPLGMHTPAFDSRYTVKKMIASSNGGEMT
jgi:hypothetical protein